MNLSSYFLRALKCKFQKSRRHIESTNVLFSCTAKESGIDQFKEAFAYGYDLVGPKAFMQ